jgi:hypothetical protein
MKRGIDLPSRMTNDFGVALRKILQLLLFATEKPHGGISLTIRPAQL